MKIKSIQFLILSLYSSILFSQNQPYEKTNFNNTEVIDIRSRLELFVDTYLIHELENTRLVLHEPEDEGPVLFFDKSWEGPFCGYATVIKTDTIYRLYYRGLPEAGKDGSIVETTCYAESDDGIQWIKPNLGIYEVSGTYENNVILAKNAPFSHNFCPFVDTKPGIPLGEKFKAVAGTKETGLAGFVSADGIHWEKLKDTPIFEKGIFDSQNVVFWSENENCYVCYFRTWTNENYEGFRTISRTTSTDFLNWCDPVYMDFGDTPIEHLYTNQTHPYFRASHIYIAIAARFMPGRQILTEEEAIHLNVDPGYFKDCSDIVFMSSRGGSHYEREFMEAFIKPGIGMQNWVSRSNYPVLNVVKINEYEMSIYVNQNYAQPSAHIRRYSLRLDGFVSVTAPYEGGEMITKPFIFKGKRLYVNYATSAAGGIRVELQTPEGEAIPGFSLQDAQELIGNEIKRKVSWVNNSDLTRLSGIPVRLHFMLRDADLYSIKFE